MGYQWIEFIKPELLILIPVLYFIGIFLKTSKKVNDCNIPLYLGAVGIVLVGIFMAADLQRSIDSWSQALFAAVTQGVLLAAAAVYANQIVKQSSKRNESAPKRIANEF